MTHPTTNGASQPPDPRILALAEGADERRKTPGVVDDLSTLRRVHEGWCALRFSKHGACSCEPVLLDYPTNGKEPT